MKALTKVIEENYQKIIKLRNLNLTDASFIQRSNIRKEQNKAYKKCLFFKQLNKAMKEGSNNDNFR